MAANLRVTPEELRKASQMNSHPSGQVKHLWRIALN